MKKAISLLLTLTLVLSLAACAGKTEEKPEPSPAPVEEPAPTSPEGAPMNPDLPTTPEVTPTPEDFEEPDYEEQLWLLADAYDIWKPIEDLRAMQQVCVTDLDGNGRLELLSASMGGSGLYTWTELYEVAEDRSGLVPVEYDWGGDGASEPDLMVETLPAYDAEETRWYVVGDFLRNGYAESFETLYAFCLRNGTVLHEVLGTYHYTVDEGSNVTETWQNAAGESITEEEYESLRRCEGKSPVTVRLGWKELEDGADVYKLLAESWQTWGEG
ncbi:MAG: hypothetical protein ACSW8F_01730 [bacterium]